MPGVDVAPWWGVVVPAGTPRPIIDKLAGWFNQITAERRDAPVPARAASILPRLARADGALLKTEVERWGGFVKPRRKIQPQ